MEEPLTNRLHVGLIHGDWEKREEIDSAPLAELLLFHLQHNTSSIYSLAYRRRWVQTTNSSSPNWKLSVKNWISSRMKKNRLVRILFSCNQHNKWSRFNERILQTFAHILPLFSSTEVIPIRQFKWVAYQESNGNQIIQKEGGRERAAGMCAHYWFAWSKWIEKELSVGLTTCNLSPTTTTVGKNSNRERRNEGEAGSIQTRGNL